MYFCRVQETGWSLEIAETITTTEWKCPKCDIFFTTTGIQKLQHMHGKFAKNNNNI